MRGFFAFPVEREFSKRLEKAIHPIATNLDLSVLMPEEYHVTIKYLSHFSSTYFFECLEDIAAVGVPPRDSLKAGALVLWPTVLVLECSASDELMAWQHQVNTLLERRGFIKNRHPLFKPHITLARRIRLEKDNVLEKQILELKGLFLGEGIPLKPPALWRSQAVETGRRHQDFLSLIFSANLKPQTAF